jgi:hypothetical protein
MLMTRRHRPFLADFTAALFLVALSMPKPALSATFEGIWSSDRGRSEILPSDPSFTPAGRAALDAFDPDTDDPALFCAVYMPRTMIAWGRNPMEIFQSEEQLWIVFERMHQVRRIFLDGRPPLEDEGPTWMGHSTGRWDGETLIVETVNMRESIFHWSGLPLSEETRVTERFTRINEETLEIEMTVIDPVNYEESWTTRHTWRLDPDVGFFEYECQ